MVAAKIKTRPKNSLSLGDRCRGLSAHLQKELDRKEIVQQAVRHIIQQHHLPPALAEERRGQERWAFLHPIQVWTEDGRHFTLLSRDLSSSGIRLIGTRRLLGQKIRIAVPGPSNSPSHTFQVRILWTCSLADDLFENGGVFLELISQ